MSYTINSNLREFVPITAKRIEQYLKIRRAVHLKELGEAIVKTGMLFNLNPYYILAHAIHESGWGTSRIAEVKNNLFGYGAFDATAFDSAFTFPTKEACIVFVMFKVVTDYLEPTGKFWGGESSLAGMNKKYASDLTWGGKLCILMNQLEKNL